LSRIPILSGCNQEVFRTWAKIATNVEFLAGTTIISQGDIIEGFYFIRQGRCDVFKKFNTSSVSAKNVFIGTLEKTDYFGEEIAFGEALDDEQSTATRALLDRRKEKSFGRSHLVRSSITVKVAKDCEKVLLIKFSPYEFLHKLKTYITLSPFPKYTEEQVQSRQEQLDKEKAWNKKKETFFTKLLREKYADPRMSVQSYLTMMDNKQKVWRV
jgi:hypothetical protein